MTDKVIAVVGATGQQGGATVRALLDQGATVRGLVRDPEAAKAQALADRGVELVRADLKDPGSLRAAFTGTDGVFAMSTVGGKDGLAGETADGCAIADAVRDVDVPNLVYNSVGGAERNSGIPHFESKRRVEEYVTSLGLPAVFVRPVFFMENFYRTVPKMEDGTLVLRMPMPGDINLQMVAVDDIGAVSAAALLDPSRVPGGSIEIAGDQLTGDQIAEAFGRDAGVEARYVALPLEVLNGNPDNQDMFAWFAQTPAYQADFAATRDLAPGVRTLATWLRERTTR